MDNDCEDVAGQRGSRISSDCNSARTWPGLNKRLDNRRCRITEPARPLPSTDTFNDCHRWITIVKLSLGREVLGYLQIVPLHVDSLVLTNDLTIVAVALVDASNRPHLFVRLQCNNHESDAILTPDTSAEYLKHARTVILAMGEDLFSVVRMRRC